MTIIPVRRRDQRPPPPGYYQGPPGPPSMQGPQFADYQGPPASNVSGAYSGPSAGQGAWGGPPELREVEDASIMGRMSGALRRTPSPQQILDGASKKVVAGVSAAGAAVTGALSSIIEEGQTRLRRSSEAGLKKLIRRVEGNHRGPRIEGQN